VGRYPQLQWQSPSDSDAELIALTSVDPTRPTIVLTHGLGALGQSATAASKIWTGSEPHQAGELLFDFYITRFAQVPNGVNIFQFVWPDALTIGLTHDYANFTDYQVARMKVPDAALALGNKLVEQLPHYDQPIQFIGHSLGSVINALAANYFLTLPEINVPAAQLTILDRPQHIGKIPVSLTLGRCSDVYSTAYCESFGYNDFNLFGPSLRDIQLKRPQLALTVDNYYTLSGAGVGDCSEVANYGNCSLPLKGKLDDPDTVGAAFFPDETDFEFFHDDHNGVQQWYRWTIDPAFFTISPEVGPCTNPLNPSLHPCVAGWPLSILNPDHLPIPPAISVTLVGGRSSLRP
jgi:hypothetical protein